MQWTPSITSRAIFAGLVVATVRFTNSAVAEGGREALFPLMDKGHDGVVNRDEFLDFYRGVFKRKDVNADGSLAEGEHPAASLRIMDRDKDGKVTQQEWDALFTRQFKNRDADGDKQLNKAEWDGTTAPPETPPAPPAEGSKTGDFTDDNAEVEKLASLTTAPAMQDAEGFPSADGIRAIYLDGLPWQGKPTKVFAWIGIPDGGGKNVPGLVLVQGGGGTAFREWVEKWNQKGFAAISIAVEGQTSKKAAGQWKRHEWAGPARNGIYGDSAAPITEQWMYHAVADTILANSLLRSQPGIDPEKVGLMGISWGGVITSTVIGIDTRFAFAVPVYGCGGLSGAENQYGRALGGNAVYQKVWDPLLRLGNAKMPTLWFSWPTDQHFPLDCQAASYHAAPGARMVALVPGMNHGHSPAWNRPESYAFAEAVVREGRPWCVQTEVTSTDGSAGATFDSSKPLTSATIVSTTGVGITGSRRWNESAAEIGRSGTGWKVRAPLPAGITAWFINVRSGALIASSDYQTVTAETR